MKRLLLIPLVLFVLSYTLANNRDICEISVENQDGWNLVGLPVYVSDDNYQSWKLKRQGFFDEFEVEMHPLVQSFEDLFVIENGQHPKLLKEFLGGRVSLETVIILNDLVGFDKTWNKEMEEDIVWIDLRNLMNNYERFLTIDEKRYRMKLLKLIEEST